MNIIVGGGTGFVGKSLIAALLHNNHQVSVVGRSKDKIHSIFKSAVTAITWNELDSLSPDNFDTIINLTGENIANNRWTQATKDKMISSRVQSTKQFILWCSHAQTKKPHLYNASAVGIYGLQKEIPNIRAHTENQQIINDNSFSQYIVSTWEETAKTATQMNIPVTIMRFGVVLKRHEGMLKKLEFPTKLGLGATLGTGQQPLAWIDINDLVNAILFLLAHPDITGTINLVAPEIVTQKTFNATLASVLHRPTLFSMPTWFVKLAFGQMGEELLLSGQAVEPARLTEHHFQFKFPTLLSALTKEFTLK